MQLNITGHHIEITPSLSNYVKEKTKRLTRHFDQVAIDSLADKLDRQVLKHKEKITRKHRHEGSHRNIIAE